MEKEKNLSWIFFMVLIFMFGLAVFLTGCGTPLTNVENKEKGIIYNGGSVSLPESLPECRRYRQAADEREDFYLR